MAIRRSFLQKWAGGMRALAAGALVLASSGMALAQGMPGESPARESPTYADLVELAQQSDLVGIVLIDNQITVPPERAPNVAPGKVRLYIEAETQTVLAAPRAIGEGLVFLVDVPLDLRGKAPKIEKQTYLVFGDLNLARPRELQLISSAAMLPTGPLAGPQAGPPTGPLADPAIEQRVRRVLTQLAAPDKPAAITGIKDVISIPGNLAGESETQFFVETETGAPVSMNVIRRPGMAPRWGISLGDIVDPAARPPQPETLAWYHFACHLPPELPEAAFLQSERQAREQARADYAVILRDLGACERRL